MSAYSEVATGLAAAGFMALSKPMTSHTGATRAVEARAWPDRSHLSSGLTMR